MKCNFCGHQFHRNEMFHFTEEYHIMCDECWHIEENHVICSVCDEWIENGGLYDGEANEWYCSDECKKEYSDGCC